jgi:hypothetical protein
MMEGLFEVPADVVRVTESVVKLSADRRRTLRQARTLAQGFHPLGGRLHLQAAPAVDRKAEGRRCGGCVNFRPGRFAKCGLGPITHGPATDCRAWWPGCVHHSPKINEESTS